MKHLLYIVLILVFATSCKKKTAVVIQAQDYITGEGSTYAGQEYAVAESWTPFQETKSKIVATGFLDANGKASFNLKMKNNRKYVMGVSEPDIYVTEVLCSIIWNMRRVIWLILIF